MGKNVQVLILALLTFNVFAGPKKGILIDVSLFPAGSFQIKAKLKGSVKNQGGILSASKLESKVSSFRTGMELRDDHTKKALKYKKFPKITVSKLKAKNGKGTAFIKIMNTKKKISFNYKDLTKKYARAKFNLSLKQFGIKGINFKGVGVEDTVKVTATVKKK